MLEISISVQNETIYDAGPHQVDITLLPLNGYRESIREEEDAVVIRRRQDDCTPLCTAATRGAIHRSSTPPPKRPRLRK